VRPVLPRDVLSVDQPQIGLIDERSRLQTVPDALMADVPPRDAVEFGIDQRDEALEGVLVAFAPFEQQSSDLRGVVGNGAILVLKPIIWPFNLLR
jgi:hypothetical protein